MAEDAKLFLLLADLFAHYHCSSSYILREGAWISGPDKMRSRDLMVSGREEAETEESVCSPTEGRRNQRSIYFALVVNVVDD